jgi:hypothetical protein
VPLAVDAPEPAVVAVQLGDVERPAVTFGDPEQGRHPGPRGRRQQRPHRPGVDAQGALRAGAGIDRPGQGELGEHGQLAALDAGLVEGGQVPGQVAVEVALLGAGGGEQDPHPSPPGGTDRLPGRPIQRSSTA